ncbi:fatty acid-binding protein 1-like [Ostrinia furnacalis]|uniref:fatty acid-binding protein 1-like n=1 Tax=Ostrinia furnacalis TaxID=93504 RepID=UPI00103F7490|nr:fatty acid-binding protein 1-like [Ostrinia furnacalis]
MAYFGKEFKLVSEENFVDFIKALELPEELAAKFSSYKPTTKIEKDGDSYKFTNTTPEGTKVTTFKSGVEFEDEVRPGVKVNSKYTVDGDTVIQDITQGTKIAKFKREYTADALTTVI